MRRFLMAAVAAHAADTLTTVVGLGLGASESAPVARAALEAYGAAGLFLVPLAGLIVQTVVIRLMPRRFRPAGMAVVLVVAAIPVVLNVQTVARLMP